MIRVLLFDFDGLLVDTEPPGYESWREVYVEHGVDLSVEAYRPAVGTGSSISLVDGGFDAIAHLEGLIGRPVDRDEIVERRLRRKLELCESAPLLAGVHELLGRARELGLRTAIVTRNTEEWVARHSARLGLLHAWDAIVCANEEPTMDKTELYLRAIEQLGVSPGEAIAFEDSPSGVEAAARAGIFCVAVPNGITRGAPFDDADVVYGSLAEVPLGELVQATATRSA
jgi:HAD superfamily hydrolase (TIGR01509 family)